MVIGHQGLVSVPLRNVQQRVNSCGRKPRVTGRMRTRDCCSRVKTAWKLQKTKAGTTALLRFDWGMPEISVDGTC